MSLSLACLYRHMYLPNLSLVVQLSLDSLLDSTAHSSFNGTPYFEPENTVQNCRATPFQKTGYGSLKVRLRGVSKCYTGSILQSFVHHYHNLISKPALSIFHKWWNKREVHFLLASSPFLQIPEPAVNCLEDVLLVAEETRKCRLFGIDVRTGQEELLVGMSREEPRRWYR